MGKLPYIWVGIALWVVLCYYYIMNAKIKLSINNLLMMIPQWCEITDLIGSGCIELSPEDTLVYCATTVVLLVFCWYLTEQDDIVELNIETSTMYFEVKKDNAKEDVRKDVLWESVRSLMDQVHLEIDHCDTSVASNNETPGMIVGGEAEWASGETNSDDDDFDATREITGAHLRKSIKEAEDIQILKFHQRPLKEGPIPKL